LQWSNTTSWLELCKIVPNLNDQVSFWLFTAPPDSDFGIVTIIFPVSIPKSESGGAVNNQNDTWSFKFGTILHNSSQEVVFDHCKECIKSILDGFNGTIMA
jgi:hypothetical protein